MSGLNLSTQPHKIKNERIKKIELGLKRHIKPLEQGKKNSFHYRDIACAIWQIALVSPYLYNTEDNDFGMFKILRNFIRINFS